MAATSWVVSCPGESSVNAQLGPVASISLPSKRVDSLIKQVESIHHELASHLKDLKGRPAEDSGAKLGGSEGAVVARLRDELAIAHSAAFAGHTLAECFRIEAETLRGQVRSPATNSGNCIQDSPVFMGLSPVSHVSSTVGSSSENVELQRLREEVVMLQRLVGNLVPHLANAYIGDQTRAEGVSVIPGDTHSQAVPPLPCFAHAMSDTSGKCAVVPLDESAASTGGGKLHKIDDFGTDILVTSATGGLHGRINGTPSPQYVSLLGAVHSNSLSPLYVDPHLRNGATTPSGKLAQTENFSKMQRPTRLTSKAFWPWQFQSDSEARMSSTAATASRSRSMSSVPGIDTGIAAGITVCSRSRRKTAVDNAAGSAIEVEAGITVTTTRSANTFVGKLVKPIAGSLCVAPMLGSRYGRDPSRSRSISPVNVRHDPAADMQWLGHQRSTSSAYPSGENLLCVLPTPRPIYQEIQTVTTSQQAATVPVPRRWPQIHSSVVNGVATPIRKSIIPRQGASAQQTPRIR